MKKSMNWILPIALSILAIANVWSVTLYTQSVSKQKEQEKALGEMCDRVLILENKSINPGEIQSIVRAEINSLELRLYKDGLIRYNPAKTK